MSDSCSSKCEQCEEFIPGVRLSFEELYELGNELAEAHGKGLSQCPFNLPFPVQALTMRLLAEVTIANSLALLDMEEIGATILSYMGMVWYTSKADNEKTRQLEELLKDVDTE